MWFSEVIIWDVLFQVESIIVCMYKFMCLGVWNEFSSKVYMRSLRRFVDFCWSYELDWTILRHASCCDKSSFDIAGINFVTD